MKKLSRSKKTIKMELLLPFYVNVVGIYMTGKLLQKIKINAGKLCVS